MKSVELIGSVSRLQHATAHLKEHWALAKTHWTDKTSQDFEKNYLQALPAQVTLVAAAIYKLADLLTQAEKELADRRESDDAG